MKNKKWIWWTLTILLTLVILAGVGFAGYRMGVMQGANLTAEGAVFMFHHGRGFDGGMMNDGFSMHGFDHGRGGFGERGGFGFFGPLFGLLRLALLGGLIWLGYTFVKRSGWRVVKTAPTPTPVAAEVEEKKDEA